MWALQGPPPVLTQTLTARLQRPPSADKIGCKYQGDSLALDLRQDFGEDLQCFGMRVADGQRGAFFAGVANGQRKLFPDGAGRLLIVQKNLPRRGGNARVVRGSLSNGGRRCPAVDKK